MVATKTIYEMNTFTEKAPMVNHQHGHRRNHNREICLQVVKWGTQRKSNKRKRRERNHDRDNKITHSYFLEV